MVIDRTLTYRFTASFLWVMAGLRRPDQISADLRRLRRRGIEMVEAEVTEIDVAGQTVNTSAAQFGYDRLVVALGAELAPDALPGFAEAAHNVYTLEGAAAAGEALQRFAEGRLVVAVSSLPYKCPAAPYETALLAEAVLRRRGVREKTSIEIYTPDPFPMASAGPELGAALTAMLEERGIGAHFEQTIERIDPRSRELILAGGERVGYDLLLGVPPHRAPEAARHAGLGDPTGFVPVDSATLETQAEGVHAIGDATVIPIAGGKSLPKAGVFAHAQAEVVASRIADDLLGRRPTVVFDGKGSCFVEMGDGRASFATGNFYAAGAPEVRLHQPGRRWHLAKVAFEQYWMRRWVR
jgi:sulfide:quinone oxidoreductase